MSLSLKGITANDLILAGNQMDLSGSIKDDVVAAVCPVCPLGGRLHLTDAMQIGDDARLAGRDIIVDGRIGGDLYVAARHFKLSGEIAGNAKVEAERIVLAPSARIGGYLYYAGPTKPEVPDGAVVAGPIRQVQTDFPFAERLQKRWIWYGILTVLAILLALALLGATAQLATPGLLSGGAAIAVERPWASLGRGLVLAVLAPAAIALLLATVIWHTNWIDHHSCLFRSACAGVCHNLLLHWALCARPLRQEGRASGAWIKSTVDQHWHSHPGDRRPYSVCWVGDWGACNHRRVGRSNQPTWAIISPDRYRAHSNLGRLSRSIQFGSGRSRRLIYREGDDDA